MVVDGDPMVPSSPQSHHDPTFLVDPTPRTIDVRHADHHLIDIGAEPPKRKVQTPLNVLPQFVTDLHTRARNRAAHRLTPIAGMPLDPPNQIVCLRGNAIR
jgi:hypothetical protein